MKTTKGLDISSFHKGWYLLYTNSKQEKKVAGQYANMEIQFLLPMIKVEREWSDRIKILNSPLFPSYLFVYLSHFDDYFRCLEAPGALNFVRFGKNLARVSDTVIENIRILINANEQLEISFNHFKKGEAVKISEGLFSGLNCEVIRYKNKDMILVRVDLLQRNLILETPIGHLSKI
jgi:transcription antitermination factor NusG